MHCAAVVVLSIYRVSILSFFLGLLLVYSQLNQPKRAIGAPARATAPWTLARKDRGTWRAMAMAMAMLRPAALPVCGAPVRRRLPSTGRRSDAARCRRDARAQPGIRISIRVGGDADAGLGPTDRAEHGHCGAASGVVRIKSQREWRDTATARLAWLGAGRTHVRRDAPRRPALPVSRRCYAHRPRGATHGRSIIIYLLYKITPEIYSLGMKLYPTILLEKIAFCSTYR
ncbi:hypothetical protein HYPSUDRAFT_212983 [Hypholoma sublateritium FD-334 SS-4]|uniref:Uncharacterized protein n=1 Tax=Hypholoma sublateritium (strain FD-334 SS-4) TaxID=945553 RepID=A0A0D2Q5K5_HYPSF|nr:hypothetical protein HYPSUDRAFT_212983 [Hypholoma sublateritium FD-334 SS-4]